MSFIDTGAAVFIAAATGLAAVAAYSSAKAANGSTRAADTLAAIERQRRHSELAPRLTLTLSHHKPPEQGPGRAGPDLKIRFDGPAALRHLDEVHLTVRDDRDHTQRPELAGSPTTEAIRAVIWGPLRFRPRTGGADRLGRAMTPFSLELGEARMCTLEGTMVPDWYEGNDSPQRWRQEHEQEPLRLWLECRAAGGESWKFTCDLPAGGGVVQTRWT